MRRYKTSKRGLTFSITPDEQYHPGSHYVYEVRKNCIIIRPSEEGMTVSRKKCGEKEKALFDIRQKDVRRAVSTSDYLEMEVKEDRIVVRCVKEVRNRIISLEEVLKEFCISKATLSMAAGLEGQISFDEYLASIAEDTQLENDLKQVFSVMSLFSGAGMLDWAFYKDPAFEINTISPKNIKEGWNVSTDAGISDGSLTSADFLSDRVFRYDSRKKEIVTVL